MYLEFDDLEQYLQHIRELMPCQTRAGLKTLYGERSGKFDTIVGVSVYAVPSLRSKTSFTQNCGDYIALFSCRVGRTTSHHLEHDKESPVLERSEGTAKIIQVFEEVKASVR